MQSAFAFDFETETAPPPAAAPAAAQARQPLTLDWPESLMRWSRQGEGGRTQVWCADPADDWRGPASVLAGMQAMGGSEFLSLQWGINVGSLPSECFASPKPRLSEILERTPDARYALTPRACLGILRRSEKRGKSLPETLRQALEQVAAAATDEDRAAPITDNDDEADE